jgi:hypothetical protein
MNVLFAIVRVVWLLSKVAPALIVALHPSAWAQEAQHNDRDRANISRMEANQLALSILSVRTDLGQYSIDDLTTTSGQYELLYEEAMTPCTHRKELPQPQATCAGSSPNVGFLRYLKSNQRVCPDPATGSCWKPALSEEQMREELLQLVGKLRERRGKRETF